MYQLLSIEFLVIICISLIAIFSIVLFFVVKKNKKRVSILMNDLFTVEQVVQELKPQLQNAKEALEKNEHVISTQKNELEILQTKYQTEKEKHWQTKQAQIKAENDLNRLKQNQ